VHSRSRKNKTQKAAEKKEKKRKRKERKTRKCFVIFPIAFFGFFFFCCFFLVRLFRSAQLLNVHTVGFVRLLEKIEQPHNTLLLGFLIRAASCAQEIAWKSSKKDKKLGVIAPKSGTWRTSKKKEEKEREKRTNK
jgi:heme/copper-type cytochrome/quinol oxidase subunit 3